MNIRITVKFLSLKFTVFNSFCSKNLIIDYFVFFFNYKFLFMIFYYYFEIDKKSTDEFRLKSIVLTNFNFSSLAI